ncbi:pentatricopeptide repeat-containing protein [Quercus suber]|uniref:Pentatricopeptide repeat-containing protein n=1 Tax=Quercus suber TaxID=58331 RepID=A0AAW0M1Z1_QUESU
MVQFVEREEREKAEACEDYCRQGQMNEAKLILWKMIEKGVNPDRFTYINGHVSQDNLKEVFGFHDENIRCYLRKASKKSHLAMINISAVSFQPQRFPLTQCRDKDY